MILRAVVVGRGPGADVAYPDEYHGTHGTIDCMGRAKAAGITVRPFTPRAGA